MHPLLCFQVSTAESKCQQEKEERALAATTGKRRLSLKQIFSTSLYFNVHFGIQQALLSSLYVSIRLIQQKIVKHQDIMKFTRVLSVTSNMPTVLTTAPQDFCKTNDHQ